MTRVTSQKVRQMLLVTGEALDPSELPEKLELYNELGEALALGGSYSRHDLEDTSAPIAPQVVQYSDIEVYPSWRVFKMSTNRPARVRMYPNASMRAADTVRPIGTKPRDNSGRLLEVVTTPGVLSLVLSPAVDLSSETVLDPTFYVSLTNLDSVAGAVVVTYNYIRTE